MGKASWKPFQSERIFPQLDESKVRLFSPDGRWIAYSSHDEAGKGIFGRPADVGCPGRWQISFGKGRYPTWSRSSHQLLFQDDEGQIMVVDYEVSGDSFSAGKPVPWVDKRFRLAERRLRIFDLAPDGKRIAVLPDLERVQATSMQSSC